MVHRQSTATLVTTATLLAALAGVVIALAAPETAPSELMTATVALHPARTSYAVYLLMIAAISLPAIYLSIAYWLPDQPAETSPAMSQRTGGYLATWLFAVCIAVLATGYATEALRAEILLTPTSLIYRASDQKTEVSWGDVTAMQLLLSRNEQTLTIRTQNGVSVLIDLAVFSPLSAHALLQSLADRSQLVPTGEQNGEQRSWRRATRHIIPAE